MDLPLNLLIKSNDDLKMEKDYGKFKTHRDPISEKSDIYEFIMALFDNSNT